MIYTIENNSSEDRDTFISITATSDRNKAYADTYLSSVEKGIERKIGKPLWGKTELQKIQEKRDPKDLKYHYTTFKSGEKRECVAIFNKLDPGANNIKIVIRGLSNDFHVIESEDGTRSIEERVFQLEYVRPKDGYGINLDSFNLKKKHWAKKQTKLVIPQAQE